MQLANITVAIGGDAGNTVKKFQVTPSELAVLRVIHGEDSVTEIEVTGEDRRTTRAEKERLSNIYGQTKDANNNPVLGQLFPGAAARLFDKFEELELDESFYKATQRSTAASPVAEPAVEEPAVEAAAEDLQPAAAQLDEAKQAEIEEAVNEDGIEDLDGGGKQDVLG